MKTTEKLIQAIQADKELSKSIEKVKYYNNEAFARDAQRYIKAIKEGRMVCNIVSVANSGMSRNMRFVSMEKYKNENRYTLNNYFALFLALGYTRKDDAFRIGGCGMDMVFATNYNIIHKFKRIGLLTEKECSQLAQMTPSCI